MAVKISVIIPVYNMEQYLRQCLESVQQQTLKEIEIICINDGSTDESQQILESFATKDGRFALFKQVNSGVAASRNFGIENAQGEYLIFMDPDDWYPELDILEVLYEKAMQNGALICGGEFSDYDDSAGTYGFDFPKCYYGYRFDKEEEINYKDYQFDFGYQRFLFQREMIINNHLFFPELVRFQDPPFFVKAMLTASSFYAIRKVTYCYRYGHRGNIWTEEKVKALLDGLLMNLTIAMQENLDILKRLTIFRLNKEFGMTILDFVVAGNLDVFQKVDEIYRMCYDSEKSSISEFYFEHIVDMILKKREDMEIIRLLQEKLERVETKNIKLENSKTFKIGKIVMYVPQKIYWWLNDIVQ